MKIQMNIDLTQNYSPNMHQKPSFSGSIHVKLKNLQPQIADVFEQTVREEIGAGVLKYYYEIGEQKIYQNILVGFGKYKGEPTGELKQLFIATGNDYSLAYQKGEEFAQNKIEKVDKPLLEKIKNILQKIGVANDSIVTASIQRPFTSQPLNEINAPILIRSRFGRNGQLEKINSKNPSTIISSDLQEAYQYYFDGKTGNVFDIKSID